MKKLIIISILSILILGCANKKSFKMPSKYPDVKFAAASDIHFFDPELGTTGSAFQNYLDNDRKLLAESKEITESFTKQIISSDIQFLIISGDLTKDGEKINHIKMAAYLKQIEDSGKKVYVINGNHDILNPESLSFQDNKTIPVPNITPQEFKEIYSEFGYSEAILKDSASLSYVAEPAPNLWLLMIDSCKYKNDLKLSITEGEVKKDTLNWIKNCLNTASTKNISVIAVMHHGLLEHYPNNKKHYPEFVIKNSSEVTNLFLNSGINIIFTGHYHAQDAVIKKKKSSFLLDIETGSPLTYPCPYRILTINNNIISSESYFIEKIDSNPNLKNYSKNFRYSGSSLLAEEALKKYGANAKDLSILVPKISSAYISHLVGDEVKPDNYLNFNGVRFFPKLIISFRKSLIRDWYTDLPPSDNNFSIDLYTGKEVQNK